MLTIHPSWTRLETQTHSSLSAGFQTGYRTRPPATGWERSQQSGSQEAPALSPCCWYSGTFWHDSGLDESAPFLTNSQTVFRGCHRPEIAPRKLFKRCWLLLGMKDFRPHRYKLYRDICPKGWRTNPLPPHWNKSSKWRKGSFPVLYTYECSF